MLVSRPMSSPGGPGLSNTNPEPLGAPDPGIQPDAARGDHIHKMPTAAEVGADAAGAAAAAQAAANAYTDAAIFAVTSSADRARIATLVTIPDLSSVTLNTLETPPITLLQGDKVLVLGQASPGGALSPSTAYAGLYDVGPVVAGAAALTRNPSYNTAVEICGATWFVTDGTYSNDFWACTNDPATTTLGTTLLTFVQIAGALSNNPAQALGVAASGTSHDVSRADHVHAMPTAGDVGAMVNPMTTVGDLITGGASGAPGRLGIGSNGTVLTVTAGVPAWAAAAGGPVIGTGTYAARPASPSVGDSYTVTSGARRGSVYRCDVAGSWSLVTLAVPQLGACVAIFDGEHGVGRVGSTLNRWVNLSPRARGYDLSYPGIGNAPQPLAASAVAGLLLEDTSSTITTLRTILPSTTATGARTIAALVRPTAYAGITTRVMEWGINGALASIGFCSRESYVDKWVVDFRGSPLASTVNSIETGLVVVVATYDGTTVRLYRESTEIASGARTLVNGADAYLSVMCGVAADNAQPGQMAFAGAWDVALSAGEVSTLTSLLRERYGI